MSENPVGKAPINQPLTQKNGRPSLAWSKWFELVFRQVNRFSHMNIRGASASFTGRATTGDVTLDTAFNLDSVTRTSQGVYQGTLSSTTAYGCNLLDDCHGVITNVIAPTGNTSAFQTEFEVVDTETFAISCYELVQGAGSSINRQLFDPVGVSDKINLVILSSISSEGLIR